MMTRDDAAVFVNGYDYPYSLIGFYVSLTSTSGLQCSGEILDINEHQLGGGENRHLDMLLKTEDFGYLFVNFDQVATIYVSPKRGLPALDELLEALNNTDNAEERGESHEDKADAIF